MKTKASQIIQYFLLLSIGLYLSWLFFKGLNMEELREVMSTGNFSWFYLVMLVSLLTYIIRVLRWQMLIRAIGYESKFLHTFSALSISYFVSFVVPRLGEVTRCLSVKKHSNIPFMELLGTVIIERVVDIISLLIVLLLTIILQFDQTIGFFKENIFRPFYDHILVKLNDGDNKTILILFVLLLTGFLIVYFRKKIALHSPKFVHQIIKGFKEGLISVSKLEQKKLFIFYTFSIWVCYFFMTYFWFLIFKETSALGWGACLTIICIGTIGRSVPIQGAGMGAYHFLVQKVVMLYGISGLFGKTLATLIHGGQTIFTFAMGLVGLVIFFLNYWKNK
ncbi:MAG: lysylphosphatidylglycerol synthase transmembrane domain-containing protein [Bacteroidota bacterium]